MSEIYLTGAVDDLSTPLTNMWPAMGSLYFEGQDGNRYQVLENTAYGGTSFDFFIVDPVAGTRTFAFEKTGTELGAMIAAKGGTGFGGSGCLFLGALDPHGYLLSIGVSLAGLDSHTAYHLWIINSLGELECRAAIRFNHGSIITAAPYTLGPAAITGSKSLDDAIVFIYAGKSNLQYFCAQRLPGISSFESLNGTIYSSTVYNYNNIDFHNTYNDRWGPYVTNIENETSYRNSKRYFWILPHTGSGTRVYFYVGKADVQWHLDNPGSSRLSTFISANASTYPNGFCGYVNIGNVVFSSSGQWSPNVEPTIDMTVVRNQGGGNFFPASLYNSDGTTDTKGYSDYDPAPVVRKIIGGTNTGKYYVIFSGTLKEAPFDQYANTPEYTLLARWAMFMYDPSTGVHELIEKGAAEPADIADYGYLPENTLYPVNSMVDFDPDSRTLLWSIDYYLPGGGSTASFRNGFGTLGVLEADGLPCFLEETDLSYYDFVAKYP